MLSCLLTTSRAVTPSVMWAALDFSFLREEETTAGATSPRYFEWLEANSHWLYPALVVLCVALVVWGVMKPIVARSPDGLRRHELKRSIIAKLRAKPSGLGLHYFRGEFQLSQEEALELLGELERDRSVKYDAAQEVWRMSDIYQS